MANAKQGDSVEVHYTGRLKDGTVFDSSEGRPPLSFTLGAGQVIPGFEEAVLGMAEGETKQHTIPPEEAYGAYREDLVVPIPRAHLPPGAPPEPGQHLELHLRDGGVIQARVEAVTDDAVVIDANHPLAGQTLVFDIELVKIR
ncbi:peptidylprolyl isomerase [Rhodocaloribacter litoris]|nr:peptidylprolyl isomerase [Rhodocaloribacter litoris]QXD13973.1 peptidylprolyl isomerase [Rhodocaloribacter litoris]